MERLLRFAVEHDRVIRLMFMRDGRLFQVNAHIVSYDDKQVSFVTTRSPRTQVISREELLAVDFRRGDDGQVVQSLPACQQTKRTPHSGKERSEGWSKRKRNPRH